MASLSSWVLPIALWVASSLAGGLIGAWAFDKWTGKQRPLPLPLPRGEDVEKRWLDERLGAIYRVYQTTIDRFEAENKRANAHWDGTYTPEQKAHLDALCVRAGEIIGLSRFPLDIDLKRSSR